MAKSKKETKLDKKYTEEEVKVATKHAKWDMFTEYAPYLMIIAVIILIRLFIATPVTVQGSSMSPTLFNGDTMILYKLSKHLKGLDRFDIVVVKSDGGRLIKRIIGKPGDTIKYEAIEQSNGILTGQLYVNGKKVEEKFLNNNAKYDTCTNDPDICSEEGVKVKKGYYYVIGDNRGHSKDSRMIGQIKYDDIIGTAKLILFPFNRFGTVE